MKKVLLLSILVVFLFNSMGYYFFFELKKHLTRTEMQSMNKRHPEKTIVLRIVDVVNNKEFQRIHKKEFRYKGEMYDIVREYKSGQTTVFVCFHDIKESKLFAGLKRVNHDKLHCAVWDQHINIVLSNPSIDLSPVFTGDLIFPQIETFLKSTTLPTWSPPPEFA